MPGGAGRLASPDLQREFFFLHPALKEWVRANPGGKAWTRNPDVLVGDGLPYEPEAPPVRLTVLNQQPTVQISGSTVLQPRHGRSSDHLRFLFLALWAWKLRGAGRVWPTVADLNTVRASVTHAHPGLKFPPIQAIQSHSGSPVRNWARKINQLAALTAVLPDNPPAEVDERRTASPVAKRRDGTDRRWSARFISVHAPDEVGVEAQVGFPALQVGDVCIDEIVFVPIRLG